MEESIDAVVETAAEEQSEGTETQNQKVRVELVCTGNEERSALGQFMAEEYITNEGLENIVEVTSRGTHVRKIAKAIANEKDTDLELSVKRNIVTKAYANGIYEGKNAEDAPKILEAIKEAKDCKALPEEVLVRLNQLYGKAKTSFDAKPGLNRVLALYGHKPFPSREPRQLVANGGLHIVLGMAESSTKHIATVYKESGFSPLITPYHTFTGTEEVAPIVMQTSPEKYEQFVRYFREATPIMVRNAISYGREHGIITR